MQTQVIETISRALFWLSMISAAGMYLGAFFLSARVIMGFGSACALLGTALGVCEGLQGHWGIVSILGIVVCATVAYLIFLYRLEFAPRKRPSDYW